MRTISIVSLFTLVACTGQPAHSDLPSPEKDTIPAKQLPDCFTLYEDLFHSESVISNGDSCLVEIFRPGVLHVTSGRVVVGDPVMLHHLEPIAARFPVGDFLPEVVRLRKPPNDWPVNALIRVRFSDHQPQRWKYAVSDSTLMDSADVHRKGFYGFGVDAGSALLYDAQYQESLVNMDWNVLWADSIRVRPKFIALSTGHGDGRYPAYVGFDSTGAPCQLIVDFLLVECTCTPRSDAPDKNE